MVTIVNLDHALFNSYESVGFDSELNMAIFWIWDSQNIVLTESTWDKINPSFESTDYTVSFNSNNTSTNQ